MRVLINLENLNAEMKAIDDKTPMLELQHNVKLILDKVEADIQNFDNQNLRHASKGEGASLERELEGVALERDFMVETTARQHRGYYGSHWIESKKVLW